MYTLTVCGCSTPLKVFTSLTTPGHTGSECPATLAQTRLPSWWSIVNSSVTLRLRQIRGMSGSRNLPDDLRLFSFKSSIAEVLLLLKTSEWSQLLHTCSPTNLPSWIPPYRPVRRWRRQITFQDWIWKDERVTNYYKHQRKRFPHVLLLIFDVDIRIISYTVVYNKIIIVLV